MSKEEAEKRIKKLRSEIARLRNAYHVDNAPTVTDDVYDSLTRELKELLSQYPELENKNSPENRVAGKPLDKFEKVTHSSRMLSLNDAFSYEELLEWENRIKKLLPASAKLEYFCEVKFDGLAVSLIYKDGIFVRGATRGDGFVGEDVTQNLKTINSIPLLIKNKSSDFLEVRGEVLLSKKTLDLLNKKNAREGKTLFANTRNAAAGSVRQLDPQLAADRNLDFYAYDLFGSEESKHSDLHKELKTFGFNVDKNEAVCKNLEEVKNFIEKFEKIRSKFPYGTDGIVVSVNNLELQKVLGVVGKAPRYMVAFKYPAEKATTIVRDVKINVGRTGVLTPLAIFEPTLVAGSTVSKATLHNMDQIERLDLRIGDTVVIEKAGDVIPKVVEVLTRMRTGKEKKVKMPKTCPACGGAVDQKTEGGSRVKNSVDGRFRPQGGVMSQNFLRASISSPVPSSVAYFCSNKKCPAKNERYLEHFVSVFDIYEMGPKILRRFKDEGLITDAADLFALTKESFIMLKDLPRRKSETFLRGFGEKSAENIVEEINQKKSIPLSKFLWALGILHVGEETARDLAQNFGTLDKMMHAVEKNVEEIDSIENIGPAVLKSLHEFFTDKNNLHFLEKLKKNGVVIEKMEKKAMGKFTDLQFVLTGTLSTMSREIAKERILALGGKVSGSVSKNTSYVVVGAEAGSKLTNAQKLGVKILSEQEFQNMLK